MPVCFPICLSACYSSAMLVLSPSLSDVSFTLMRLHQLLWGDNGDVDLATTRLLLFLQLMSLSYGCQLEWVLVFPSRALHPPLGRGVPGSNPRMNPFLLKRLKVRPNSMETPKSNLLRIFSVYVRNLQCFSAGVPHLGLWLLKARRAKRKKNSI